MRQRNEQLKRDKRMAKEHREGRSRLWRGQMRPRNEQLKRDKRMAKGGGHREGRSRFYGEGK